ncbi:MAG: hypothetical protein QOF81_2464 [Acidimicrobiaceae bacterium]|nr:hypothetical protein [Acidimicrobiaceae bacterium]
MSAPGPGEWVVVLEFVPPSPREPFAYCAIHALVEEMWAWSPAALFSTDRYALQLRIVAARPSEALRCGLDLHDRAVLAVGLRHPVLVRTEVLTGPEFDNQWDRAEAAAAPVNQGITDTVLSNDTYLATRALLQSSTTSELTEVLVSFVRAVGGQVRSGPCQAAPGELAVDLTVADGPTCHAVVDSVSVSGLIIEQSLPALVADARAAWRRLSQPAPASDQTPRPLA